MSLDVGAWNLELPLAQALLRILLQPIPETIEFLSDLRLDSSEFGRIEFSVRRPALRKKVILDLWLRSRRSNGDSSRAGGILEFKNLHLFFRDQVALDIFNHVRLEIFDSDHF